MKVHGYKIKLTAFLPAEPFNIEELRDAADKFAALNKLLADNGFNEVNFSAAPGLMLRRAPDEPKAAEAVRIEPLQEAYESVTKTADGKYEHGPERMPPVPAALRRT